MQRPGVAGVWIKWRRAAGASPSPVMRAVSGRVGCQHQAGVVRRVHKGMGFGVGQVGDPLGQGGDTRRRPRALERLGNRDGKARR